MAKPEILYITHSTIFLCKDSKTVPIPVPWNGRDSIEAFKMIKGKTHSSFFRVILGNDFSYAFSLKMPAASKKEEIIAKAGEFVPEEVTEKNISYSLLNKEYISVFSAPKILLEEVGKSAKVVNFQIEYFCPIESALSGAVEKGATPKMILYSGIEKLAVAVSENLILESEDIKTDPDKKIRELKDFISSQQGFEIKEAVSNFKKGEIKLPQSIAEKNLEIDPINFVDSHALSDKDDGFLAIKLQSKDETKKIKEETPPNSEAKATESDMPKTDDLGLPEEKKPSIIVPIILIIVILGAVGFILLKMFK